MNPNKSPIYNHVGRLILAECKANRVSYKYACVNKIEYPYVYKSETLKIMNIIYLEGLAEGLAQ